MMFKTNVILFIVFWGLICTGCNAKDEIYLEQTEMATDSGAADSEETELTAEACYVYICGAVANPGVYEVEAGSRIYEVVCMAGGLTEEADVSSVNQAEPVYDGQMIYLSSQTAGEATDGRVNINTASVEDLMTLSGIGQTKAEQILAYRDKNGKFSSVEEIMNVDGIKEGLYNRIKDDIRVN